MPPLGRFAVVVGLPLVGYGLTGFEGTGYGDGVWAIGYALSARTILICGLALLALGLTETKGP